MPWITGVQLDLKKSVVLAEGLLEECGWGMGIKEALVMSIGFYM